MSVIRLAAFAVLGALALSTLVMASASPKAQGAEVQEISPDVSRLRRLEFHSSVLQETRAIDVYLPYGYDDSNELYPVVYLLDGEIKFLHTAGILDLLYERGYPPMILVSIPNLDNATRSRDLTPEPWDVEAPNGGGADAFAEFIGSELAPEIDSRFQTRAFRVLVGHSFGGLFATHVMATRPEIFNAYVSISPSMFYAENRPLETFAEALAKSDARPTSLFIALGAEPGEEGDSIHRLYSLVADQSRGWLDWEFRTYMEETHVSVVVPATMDGLRHVFQGFVLEGPDLPQTLEETKRHYVQVSKRIGWTVLPSPRLLMNLGYRQLSMGDSKGALETLAYFTKAYPDMRASWYSLADVHGELGNRRAAIRAYERYLELAPGNREVLQKIESLQKAGED